MILLKIITDQNTHLLWSQGKPKFLPLEQVHLRKWLFGHIHYHCRCHCFKWSSGGSGLLQLIIQRIQLLANDHPEDPATCKWSSGASGHLQMIIQRIWPLANDHLEDSASCKWSAGRSDHLQMIIWRIWPLANDHLEGLASYKWLSVTPVTLITSPRI